MRVTERIAPWLAALLLACAPEAEAPRWNVLLVTLDTTRVDRVSAYGYGVETTPNLDALARDGVRFERAVVPASVTPVSHATILTGLDPYHHGLRVFYGPVGHFLSAEHATLATRLSRAGWATGGFVSALPASERFGLDQGFATFRSGIDDQVLTSDPAKRTPKDGRWQRRAVGAAQRRADATTSEALAWLATVERPWLMWVHYFDAHDPTLIPPEEATRAFSLPPEDERRYFDAYDAELHYMDAHLGTLLAAIAERGESEQTIVVVISDHGQGMGDHGWNQHRLLYQEQIAAPLVLRHPGGPRGLVVTTLARAADLAPTILDLLGMPTSPSDGRSLAPAMRGEPAPAAIAYAEALNTLDVHAPAKLPAHQKDLLFVASDGDWKLIHHYNEPANDELYHLVRDPRELENVRDAHPEQREQLLDWLRRSGAMSIEQVEPGAPMDPEMREQLEALGYGR